MQKKPAGRSVGGVVEGQEQRGFAPRRFLPNPLGFGCPDAQIIQPVILVIFKFDPVVRILGVVELWAFIFRLICFLKLNSRSLAVYWYLACLILWLAASAPYSPSKNLSFVHPICQCRGLCGGDCGSLVLLGCGMVFFNEIQQ